MKLIPLTQDLHAIVDDEDYAAVSEFVWCAEKSRKTYYARRKVRGKTQSMHAFIMGTPSGLETHHKNDDGLDNRRENLKVISQSEHTRLRRLAKPKASGFRNVHFNKSSNRWEAAFRHQKKRIYAGHFQRAWDAAWARDVKARELGWPEDMMNFPMSW